MKGILFRRRNFGPIKLGTFCVNGGHYEYISDDGIALGRTMTLVSTCDGCHQPEPVTIDPMPEGWMRLINEAE